LKHLSLTTKPIAGTYQALFLGQANAGKVLEYVFLHDISSFLAMKYQLESNAKENCQPNIFGAFYLIAIATHGYFC